MVSCEEGNNVTMSLATKVCNTQYIHIQHRLVLNIKYSKNLLGFSYKKLCFVTNFHFISGPPATIEVDIMVRSMGPISEVDMV